MIKIAGVLLLMACGVMTGQAMSKHEKLKYQNGENMIYLLRCIQQAVWLGQNQTNQFDDHENMASKWPFFKSFSDNIRSGSSVKCAYFTAKRTAETKFLPGFEQQTDRFFAEFGTFPRQQQMEVCGCVIDACTQILQAAKPNIFAKATLLKKTVPLGFVALAILIL